MVEARPCLFLDRDGVINRNPPRGEYIARWEEMEILPAAVDWIRLFRAAGFLVVVVTNQRGVALGRMTEGELTTLHERLAEHLAELGAPVDAILYCPHAEGACQCRKPLPGMVEEAARRFAIDMKGSLLVGDSDLDRDLAANCGLAFVRVAEGRVR